MNGRPSSHSRLSACTPGCRHPAARLGTGSNPPQPSMAPALAHPKAPQHLVTPGPLGAGVLLFNQAVGAEGSPLPSAADAMAQHSAATGLLVEVEERLRDVQAEVAAYQDAIACRQGSGEASCSRAWRRQCGAPHTSVGELDGDACCSSCGGDLWGGVHAGCVWAEGGCLPACQGMQVSCLAPVEWGFSCAACHAAMPVVRHSIWPPEGRGTGCRAVTSVGVAAGRGGCPWIPVASPGTARGSVFSLGAWQHACRALRLLLGRQDLARCCPEEDYAGPACVWQGVQAAVATFPQVTSCR